MKKIVVIAIVLAFYIPLKANSWGSYCDYTNSLDRTVAWQAGQLIYLEAGAGSLEIRGEERDDVRIKAELCADDEKVLDALAVSDRTDGDKLRLKTEFPKQLLGWSGDYKAKIDLVLYVPESSLMDVRDSSGEASVKNIAGLIMVDSSGELGIEDIDGNVKVTDSSGSLEVGDVIGDVNITDSSGAIDVEDVEGSLIVEVDSSGSISARSIAKDVLIKRDSSGAIQVSEIGGDFTVVKDTSGGIRYDDVTGKVSVPE